MPFIQLYPQSQNRFFAQENDYGVEIKPQHELIAKDPWGEIFIFKKEA